MFILYRYRLAQAADNRLFVYGYDRSTADVRIVELQWFDESTLTGRALDGTAVALDGLPAFDMNAGALWAFYRHEHCIESCKDVTP